MFTDIKESTYIMLNEPFKNYHKQSIKQKKPVLEQTKN